MTMLRILCLLLCITSSAFASGEDGTVLTDSGLWRFVKEGGARNSTSTRLQQKNGPNLILCQEWTLQEKCAELEKELQTKACTEKFTYSITEKPTVQMIPKPDCIHKGILSTPLYLKIRHDGRSVLEVSKTTGEPVFTTSQIERARQAVLKEKLLYIGLFVAFGVVCIGGSYLINKPRAKA